MILIIDYLEVKEILPTQKAYKQRRQLLLLTTGLDFIYGCSKGDSEKAAERDHTEKKLGLHCFCKLVNIIVCLRLYICDQALYLYTLILFTCTGTCNKKQPSR